MSTGEISISRDGSKLVLSFLMPGDAMQANLHFECGSGWAARLLCDWLRERMQCGLRDIRRDSYNFGWKQAKAKKGAKNNWFSCNWSYRWMK